MKSSFVALLAAAAVGRVAGHATFQDLWVNGVDQGATCDRLPPSNSPVTNVQSTDIRCNVGGTSGISGKCAVNAGGKVTVEMHQQANDRSCATDAIGGDHYGPVQVYMSKVSDASTADGSTGWFKIFSDSWSSGGASTTDGVQDNWGVKDLNKNCGKMDVTIPCDIAPGDYLLRAEVVALHVAGQLNGAQFYMSCYQLTVSGSGSASPATVKFPGAYSANDPGILINIHQHLSTYIAPGPTVYTPNGCAGGSAPVSTSKPASPVSTTTKVPTTITTITKAPTTTAAPGGCSVAKYGQCGGIGFTGCTVCASGSTCKANGDYYSQCV